MKEISAAFSNFTQDDIIEIESSDKYILNLPTGDVEIFPQDVEITSEDMPGWLVSTEGKLTVALDITITEELRREGVARELVNRVQNLRKDSGFEVTDKIDILIEPNSDIEATLQDFADYICNQTLAVSINIDSSVSDNLGSMSTEWGEEGESIKILLKRV
jgi:isoleucyl-tRNA synthetase